MTENSSPESPPFADILNQTLPTMIPVVAAMGIEAIEVRPGYASMRAPLEGNSNHFGAMYAGSLFTVAELLGGALAFVSFDQSQFYPLVKDLQISFRAPARSAVTSEASLSSADITRIGAEAAATGKSEYILETTITDADGVLVATTRGVYQLRALHR